MSVIKGTAMWTCVQAPNTKFEPTWQIDLVVTKEQADSLIKESKKVNPKGISIKKTEDGLIFKLRRSVKRAKGNEDNKPPKCVDRRNKPFTELIGNGSIVNVQYDFYEWKNNFGSGVGADFKGIQVLELVSYGAADGDEFEEVDSVEDVNKEDDSEFDDEDF